MKRSGKVQIALVAGLAMTGCGRRAYDPCNPQTFNEQACQDAINHHGYYYGGHWYPHTYSGSYMSYYSGYNSYVRTGGRVTSVSPSEWSSPSASSGSSNGASSTGSGSVSRGIFGSSSHGSSGGGE